MLNGVKNFFLYGVLKWVVEFLVILLAVKVGTYFVLGKAATFITCIGVWVIWQMIKLALSR